MKKIIGVMGPGEQQSSQEDLKYAYEIGKMVAKSGAVLLCGGMTGVMEYSAKGAQEAGGLTIGIGPTKDKKDMNKYLDIPILTGMHAGRNYMNILSSDFVIFIGVGSPGTLSELAFAIQLEKPVVIINGSKKLQDYIEEFKSPSVYFTSNLREVEEKINNI